MKVIDNQNRGELSEGRDTGFAFTFVNKKLETVIPFSPCKDYLNEVIYSEIKEIPSSACGLDYAPTGVFKDDFYLAFKILDPKGSGRGLSVSNQALQSKLHENYFAIQEFLNRWETKFEIGLSEIIKAEDDTYLLKMDKWWIEDTWKISMYALFVRNALDYKGEPMNVYLTTKNTEKRDTNYLLNTYNGVLELIKRNIKSLPFTKKEYMSPHSYGIYNTIYKYIPNIDNSKITKVIPEL